MKEGSAVTKIVMLFLAGCLAAYFGIYIWQGMTDTLVTAVAYSYTVNDSEETDGLLIRQEQVLDSYSGIAEVVPGEGERVGAGQTVAVIYRDAAALERQREIRELELEAELLQYAMTQPELSDGTAQLEDDVFRAAVALRKAATAGDFARLEDQVLELKRAVLHRDYTYGQGTDTGRLMQLTSQLKQLRSQSGMDTSRVTVPRAGIYSAAVDGFERQLTPEVGLELTPGQLELLLEQDPTTEENCLGKLITSNRWYVAAALPEQRVQSLSVGGQLAVGFTGDFERVVSMRVERISRPENGACVVVLSTDRYLSNTTLLRSQTVEIIFDRQQGLRVPKAAVHILSGQGEEALTGVYAVVNGQAEFRRVEVLAEGRQFYVVRPLDEGKKTLRSGDEIVVRGQDVHEGKVLME